MADQVPQVKVLQKSKVSRSIVLHCLKGPYSKYVKLISNDGHTFVIKRKYALMSGTLKTLLNYSRSSIEHQIIEFHFSHMPSHILHIICMFFSYKAKYRNTLTNAPEFPIDQQFASDIYMAATFLDC